MTDPFEEFEFKPLTEGLGFHKQNKKEQKGNFVLSTGMDILEDSPLNPPLPRRQTRQQPAPSTDSSSAVDEILQTLRSKQSIADRAPAQATALQKNIGQPQYVKSVSNISAMFLDSMLVLAGTLLCMIILLSVTKADLGTTILSGNPDPMIFVSTLALFAVVTFIYLVTHRIFLGATPGEWAYDQRLGKPEDLGTLAFAAGAIIRSVLVVLTGIFPLALVSLVLRKDILGKISGTQILERK